MLVVDLSHTTLTEWSAVFIGLASLVSAIGSASAAILSVRNGRRIAEVHDATNGMKAELVQSTGDRRYAEGRQHGEDFPRRRRAAKRPSRSKSKAKNKIRFPH